MPQHSTLPAPRAATVTVPSAVPPLLVELWRLLAAHRTAVGQARCFDRLRALVVGTLLAVGRPTIAGLVLALELTDADWSAFDRLLGRKWLDYEILTRCYLRETLAQIPAQGPYVAVLDGTQLPRCSRTMPGTAWLTNPRTPPFKRGIHRAHLAALRPPWRGYRQTLAQQDRAHLCRGWAGTRGTWPEKEAWLQQMDTLLAHAEAA